MKQASVLWNWAVQLAFIQPMLVKIHHIKPKTVTVKTGAVTNIHMPAREIVSS